jgi:hypothetical protein
LWFERVRASGLYWFARGSDKGFRKDARLMVEAAEEELRVESATVNHSKVGVASPAGAA